MSKHGLLFLSDWHIGEDHDGFNKEIARQRVLSIPSAIPKGLDKLVVLAGGDIVTGSGIHLYQNAIITLGVREQADLAVELFTLLFEKLKSNASAISARWILGNHGRISRHAKPTDNWDLEIGRRVQEVYKGDIPVRVETTHPHTKFKLGASRFYGLHRTGRRDVHLATNARKGAIYERLFHHDCDTFLLAHFHQGTHHCDVDGSLRLIVNGALGGSEPFYAEENGFWAQPAQAFLHIDPKRKVRGEDVQWIRW